MLAALTLALALAGPDSLAMKPAALDSASVARRSVTEEVFFQSGDARLSATLTRPCGRGPWPAMVLVHGAGRATRNDFGSLPRASAALGVACLAFDKRGSGKSTGRYDDLIPTDQLANDVLAAIGTLARRSDIDTARIGLYGVGQGGWVVARVSEQRRPAFVVLRSARTLSAAEHGMYELGQKLQAAGFGQRDIAHAIRLNALVQRVIQSGTGWESLGGELHEWRRAPWFAKAGLPDSLPETPTPEIQRWAERLKSFLAYDPMPAWRRLQAPVLAYYGDRDADVPAERSASDLKDALALAGARDATVVLDPDTAHWFGERFADWLVTHAKPPDTRRCP